MSEFGDWPPALLARVIKAMSPESVCRTCGEPRRRITESDWSDAPPMVSGRLHYGQNHANPIKSEAGRVSRSQTTGFSDCGHDDWRPGAVLDPFGTGGTAEVAETLGREGIERILIPIPDPAPWTQEQLDASKQRAKERRKRLFGDSDPLAPDSQPATEGT